MPPVGFEPTISAGERLQIHALDRAATGTGCLYTSQGFKIFFLLKANHNSRRDTEHATVLLPKLLVADTVLTSLPHKQVFPVYVREEWEMAGGKVAKSLRRTTSREPST